MERLQRMTKGTGEADSAAAAAAAKRGTKAPIPVAKVTEQAAVFNLPTL